ncbi:unnamed protein product, partial [Didymodactylos carnosus]
MPTYLIYVDTHSDFWRMIYQFNVRIIVMVKPVKEPGQPPVQYWPLTAQDERTYGLYHIKFVQIHTENEYFRVTQLELTKTSNPNVPYTVYHCHYLKWRDCDVPNDIDSMINFINEVQKYPHDSSVPKVV